jgi:hypothetical protein
LLVQHESSQRSARRHRQRIGGRAHGRARVIWIAGRAQVPLVCGLASDGLWWVAPAASARACRGQVRVRTGERCLP